MSGTVVDQLLSGLVALFTAVAPADVKVADGEGPELPRRSLIVGWGGPGYDQPSVHVDFGHELVGGRRTEQAITVVCLLTCWVGNETGPSLRGETFDLFNVFAAALAGNQSVDVPGVGDARLVDMEWLSNREIDGSGAQVRFSVVVQAVA